MLLSLWIALLSLQNLSESQIWPTLVAQRQQPGTSYARIRLETRDRRSNNRWLAYRNSIFPHDGELLADSGHHSRPLGETGSGAVSDFSGLVNSPWAFARAAAMAPTVSLVAGNMRQSAASASVGLKQRRS